MTKKNIKGDAGIVIILLFILLISFIPAAIATYLYYRSYQKLPATSQKKVILFYAILSCVPLYIAGAIMFPVIFSRIFGWNYEAGISWIICILLLIFVTVPACFAYLYQIRNVNGMHTYAVSYMEELNTILKDKKFDDEEIEKLKKMAEEYKLSKNYLDPIHQQSFLTALYNSAADDLEINSSEIDFLAKIIKSFNLNKEIIDIGDDFIERIRSIKKIIDGKDQGITTTIFMPQKNERCIMLEDCTLYENVKKGIYTGGSIGLKNVAPFGQLLIPRFYIGTRIDYEKLNNIDNGKIALSTSRIVFIGDSITRSINFDDIIGLDIGKDGFQINRQGKSKKEVFKMDIHTVKLFIGALFYLKR
jgi:hypothetical protein